MCLLCVSDSAFCVGVARTDKSKDLLGNPSEMKELPEPLCIESKALRKSTFVTKQVLVEVALKAGLKLLVDKCDETWSQTSLTLASLAPLKAL